MSFPSEFCYHTIRDIEHEGSVLGSVKKKEQEKQNELADLASGMVVSLLQSSGSLQYSELVKRISKQLGYDENGEIPFGVKCAVLNAWHDKIFIMTSDRTVSLNPQNILLKKK